MNHLSARLGRLKALGVDGSTFKQEIKFKYDLNKQIIISESTGFIDSDQTEYGPRNHGIRQFNASTGEIQFWEFDTFGGVTKGTVKAKGKDIIYSYEYQGNRITDYWKYVDDFTYQYTVGSYENGDWKQIFLNTVFQAIIPLQYYSDQLEGNWSSPAWDGELNENWTRSIDNKLIQSQEYWENGIISYSANSFMQEVEDELLLVSIIEGSNPKIFQATSRSMHEIIFENSDYSNPSKVIYKFKDFGYHREIIGEENGKPSTYTFTFEKVKN